METYETRGGITVRRVVERIPLDGAIEPVLDALDSRRGVVLASSYEYPGRYTRWDMGFVDPPLEVMGAASAEGESTYAEVILTVRGCRVEPCRVMIGVNRNASEAECRRVVNQGLQQHLAKHRSDATP